MLVRWMDVVYSPTVGPVVFHPLNPYRCTVVAPVGNSNEMQSPDVVRKLCIESATASISRSQVLGLVRPVVRRRQT
jgi:hypothetical protein